MYTVYLDNNLIYDLNKGEDLLLIDPQLELELNSPGTFTCTMPLNHPYYDAPQAMLSRVQVFSDGEELFTGRIIDISIDFYKQKTLTCEGELGFLNDSIQRPAEYHEMTVRGYLETLIENHNEQVEEDKQFEVGYVLVTDSNDSLYRYTNYNSTMTEIKEDLVDDLGGYIRVRNWLGHRYIDYINIDDYGIKNEQVIRFGENLLDYTNDMDTSDIATVIIPLGEKLDESPIEALDMRLTIESVNNGSDAIESEEAVKTYGRVVKTVVWDDVTLPENLKAKGEQYLKDYQWDKMVLEVGAVDLHFTDTDIEQFHLGDQIRVISDPHGLDKWFPLAQINIPLSAPDQWSLTLGIDEEPHTLTAKVATTEDSITKVEEDTTPIQKILDQAAQQATNLITAATHGYVVVEPDEILIMDNKDKDNEKTHLWRWNMGGLGFSKTGYNGDYGDMAITMDGSICATYINSGTLNADVIRAGVIEDVKGNSYWDLKEGTISINGTITAGSGSKIGGWTSTNGKIYGGESVKNGGEGVAVMQAPSSSITNVFAAGAGGAHDDYSGCEFRVTKAGALYATNADITGKVTSTSGNIGGWFIGPHKLYSYDTTVSESKRKYTGLQSPESGTYGIAVGTDDNSSYGRAPFRVKHDGTCYADDLYCDNNVHVGGKMIVSGNIDAVGGKIISYNNEDRDKATLEVRIYNGAIDFYYGSSLSKYGTIDCTSTYGIQMYTSKALTFRSSGGLYLRGQLYVGTYSSTSSSAKTYSTKNSTVTLVTNVSRNNDGDVDLSINFDSHSWNLTVWFPTISVSKQTFHWYHGLLVSS